MARKPRVDFPGALYHVIARGNRRAVIIHDDADATAYLERLNAIAFATAERENKKTFWFSSHVMRATTYWQKFRMSPFSSPPGYGRPGQPLVHEESEAWEEHATPHGSRGARISSLSPFLRRYTASLATRSCLRCCSACHRSYWVC